MNTTMLLRSSTVIACMMLSTGCKEQPATPSSSKRVSAQSPALPKELFASEEPQGAKSVAEVKADPTIAGDVVIRGRIGGRKAVFVDGVAIFLLADTSMKSCDQLHADACKTPWDYCCEPHESLSAKTATVQVVGDDGKPLRVSVEDKNGIKPLADVTIMGTIASRDAASLVINAKRIWVAPSGK